MCVYVRKRREKDEPLKSFQRAKGVKVALTTTTIIIIATNFTTTNTIRIITTIRTIKIHYYIM